MEGLDVARFSIIIPVYNVGSYVLKCLESVSRQSFRDFECICVDDGSTDGSGTILDDYAKQDARVRVIHQANGGVSAARNAALDLAQGEWVLFLDGDDTWTSDLLQEISKRIEATPTADVVYFGAENVDENGRSLGRFGGVPPPCTMTGDAILGNGRGPYNACIWSSCDKAYRRSAIESNHIRFMVGMRLCEDSLFAQTFLAQCGDVVVASDFVGYRYLMREESAIHKELMRLPEKPFVVFVVLVDLWKKIKSPGLLVQLKWLAASYYSLGKNQIYAKHVRKDAIEYLSSSDYFNGVVVPFLVRYGSLKAKLLSVVYTILPRRAKCALLSRI